MEFNPDTDIKVYQRTMHPALIWCVPFGVLLSIILNIFVLINQNSLLKNQDDIVDTPLLGEFGDENDKIVIAVDPEWAPYCYTDHTNARTKRDPNLWEEPSGFILDVAKGACEMANLNCEFVLTTNYEECWTPKHSPGFPFITKRFDMCLCWTVTPQRVRRVLFTKDEPYFGWTKKLTSGFLVLSSIEQDDKTEWLRLRGKFDNDNCVGETMIQAADTKKWYDACGDITQDSNPDDATLKDQCIRPCVDGKLRVGIVKGWATNPETFNWIKNKFTGTYFDMSRIIFINEQSVEGETHMSSYNHLAQELENRHIDVGYTFDNVVNEMQNQECHICSQLAIWNGGVKMHKVDDVTQDQLPFAIGGVSGFFRNDNARQADAMTKGAAMYIADKARYCPKCLQYWKKESECNNFCIGCGIDAGDDGKNYCKESGMKG